MKGRDVSYKYILDDNHNIVPVDDIMAWAQWFESSDQKRIVAQTQVFPDVMVSTVFLGIDHNFMPHKDYPVLFETMVFGGELSEKQERYGTWAEAEQGHAEMCKCVVSARPPAELNDADRNE